MFYSNHAPRMISADLARAINYATYEVLGPFELGELLKKTDSNVVQVRDNGCNGMSLSEVKDLVISINERFGLLTAQGFFFQIGRVTFQYLRRNNSQMIFDNSIDKRLQPLEDQISSELEKDAKWLHKKLDYQMEVKKHKGNWMIIVNHPLERSPEISSTSYFFLKGLFHECLEWMDNRHRYVISWLSDPVHNNSFSISINPQPLN
jgi:hypothetical protein